MQKAILLYANLNGMTGQNAVLRAAQRVPLRAAQAGQKSSGSWNSQPRHEHGTRPLTCCFVGNDFEAGIHHTVLTFLVIECKFYSVPQDSLSPRGTPITSMHYIRYRL
jgi:hypothetical protein